MAAVLRRLGLGLADAGVRPVQAALPPPDRPLGADAPRAFRSDRRLRRSVRPLRGLGAVGARPRTRHTRPPTPTGRPRIPKARSLEARSRPPPLPKDVPPTAPKARRPVRTSRRSRPRNRSLAGNTNRLPSV